MIYSHNETISGNVKELTTAPKTTQMNIDIIHGGKIHTAFSYIQFKDRQF